MTILLIVLAALNLFITAAVLIWKSGLTAYGGEKGKNLARREDLDAILAEVRAVTVTQKEIESKLAGDLWHKQTLWQEKKSIFADVLTAVHKSTYACNELWQIRKLIVAGRLTENAPDLDNLLRHHFREFHEAETELIRLTALSSVVHKRRIGQTIKGILEEEACA